MCLKPDTSAQKQAVALQERQSREANAAEREDTSADKAKQLNRRRAERGGQSLASLAMFQTGAGGTGARSLYQPTGV